MTREEWFGRAMQEMDQKIKPQGSLGQLESLAIQLAAVQETLKPRMDRGSIMIFGADHGVSAEKVSAYPREVTAQMMSAFASGGAAITVLCRCLGLKVEVIDVGVDADLPELPGVVSAKVRRGSRNFLHEPAMTGEELEAALEVGRVAVHRTLARDHPDAIGLGEMGIGNTTAASALLSALTGKPSKETVGRGTGLDDHGIAVKRAVVDAALKLHAPRFADPMGALATVGGLEIASMAGAAIEAAHQRRAVIVDGFISTVAILAAVRIDPLIRSFLFFAHCSAEAGHRLALSALDATPMLDLSMRLGEGTGSALAFPILRSAAALLREMATFSQAGVADRSPE